MYVIITAIFIVLVLLFWDAIASMVKTITIDSIHNGYLWFFCLLSINIIIISFIIGFYYYKLNIIGGKGETGDKGFNGYDGDMCSINSPCIVNNNNNNNNNNNTLEE